jgi:hypothetical protein
MVRVLRVMLVGVAAGVGLVAVVLGAALFPYLRDDAVMDWMVRAVALDWRDFGRDAAVERLQYELDHQRIGLHVGDDHCALTESGDGTRQVRCAWGAALVVPGTELRWPLSFASHAAISPEGELL